MTEKINKSSGFKMRMETYVSFHSFYRHWWVFFALWYQIFCLRRILFPILHVSVLQAYRGALNKLYSGTRHLHRQYSAWSALWCPAIPLYARTPLRTGWFSRCDSPLPGFWNLERSSESRHQLEQIRKNQLKQLLHRNQKTSMWIT